MTDAKKIETGGPAFPQPVRSFDDSGFDLPGMSLRDYFAAQALALWRIDDADLKNLKDGRLPQHAAVAKFCYELADAMLKARNEEKEQRK